MKKRGIFYGLVFSLATVSSCSQPNPRDPQEQILIAGLLLYALPQQETAPLEDAECSQWSRKNRNFEKRYKAFLQDTKQYQNLILGDSTMDISGRYPGFYNPEITQNLAVGGNNLCDINRQFSVIHSKNPERILISTVGGIDLLQNIPLEKRVRSLELLLEKIQNRFPQANLVLVAVHPVRFEFVNQNRHTHNQTLWNTASNILGGFPKLCWVDPLPLFGDGNLSVSDPAPEENMIQLPNGVVDPVHYNQAMSFAIKQKWENDCNLFL